MKKIYRRFLYCSHKKKEFVSLVRMSLFNFILPNFPNVNSRMFRIVTADNAAESDIVIH